MNRTSSSSAWTEPFLQIMSKIRIKSKSTFSTKFEINKYYNTLVNSGLPFYYFNKAKLHCWIGPCLHLLQLMNKIKMNIQHKMWNKSRSQYFSKYELNFLLFLQSKASLLNRTSSSSAWTKPFLQIIVKLKMNKIKTDIPTKFEINQYQKYLSKYGLNFWPF